MENVLVIADREDRLSSIETRQWNITLYRLDYKNIESEIGALSRVIKDKEIGFAVYSRNEQVSEAPIGRITSMLRAGYTSFSGIDESHREEQMMKCFNDFLSCGVKLNYTHKKRICSIKHNRKKISKTFSLVFDMEQLGGVRFGLFPILDILREYKTEATFFTTNIMKKIYPNLLDIVAGEGHEVGLHGLFHEDISLMNVKCQSKSIKGMMHDYRKYKPCGANFIGRMNKETIISMSVNGLDYFVHPIKNTVSFLSAVPEPMLVSPYGMWLIPISAETYGKGWKGIKKQIDNTLKTQANHMTILLHPFYDGGEINRSNIERLIQYLLHKGMSPIRLDCMVRGLETYAPNVFIDYNIEKSGGGMKNAIKRKWYEKNVIQKYRKFKMRGDKPAIRLVK